MPSEEVLQAAALRLVAALDHYRSHPTPEAADRVIEARLAVKEAFVAAGWDPPESTRRAMERDRLLLQEHAGALDDQPRMPDPRRAERRARLWPPAVTMRRGFTCAVAGVATG